MAEWARVAGDSPLARKVAVAQARLLTNTGRFAAAEDVLKPIARAARRRGILARQALELLYRVEVRNREVRELLLESWADSSDPGHVLRRLYLLDDSAFPVDYVRNALAGGDPKDDRVWLGQANLAIWLGRLDEARRWLDRCAANRPDDPAVWSARLDLALASNEPGEVSKALEHLPVDWVAPGEMRWLRCWLAARGGDRVRERVELLELAAEEPGDTRAWDRLAELALEAGRRDEAGSFRGRKAEMSAIRERYITLNKRDDRAQHAGELARLATELGRKVEARGWTLIREGRAGREPLVPAAGESAVGSLAARMGDLLDLAGRARPGLRLPVRIPVGRSRRGSPIARAPTA